MIAPVLCETALSNIFPPFPSDYYLKIETITHDFFVIVSMEHEQARTSTHRPHPAAHLSQTGTLPAQLRLRLGLDVPQRVQSPASDADGAFGVRAREP